MTWKHAKGKNALFPRTLVWILFLPAAVPASGGEGMDFLSAMEFGGHLHTLATFHQRTDAAGEVTAVSGVHVNSLELGLTASPHRFLDANVVWLLEEGVGGGSAGQSFAVDQAFVTLSGNPRMLKDLEQRRGMAGAPFYLQAGKFYAPFATQLNYHTFDVVAEPPTLALGETLETGVRLGYYPDGIHLFAGAFGGPGQDGGPLDADRDGEIERENALDDYFAGASLEGALGQVTVQWMSNINNGLTLQDELGRGTDGSLTGQAEKASPGMAAYLRTGLGPLILQGSYVRVRDEYEHGVMAGHRPSAAAGELTYRVNHTWEITGVYHHTDDWPGHAQRGVGGVVGIRLAPGLSVAAQYLQRTHDRDLSGTDRERVAAVLLDVEFGELFGPLVRNRASAVE